jgi:hypothetical protein
MYYFLSLLSFRGASTTALMLPYTRDDIFIQWFCCSFYVLEYMLTDSPYITVGQKQQDW